MTSSRTCGVPWPAMTHPSEPGTPLPDVDPTPPPHPVRAWAVLCGGALLVSTGVALTIAAGLGVGSWQVFETGVMATTGAPFAVVAVVESLVATLVAWWWLDQRPGPATALFVVAVGPVIGGLLAVLPEPQGLATSLASLAVGMATLGLGVGFYVGAGLGASPQDSMFVGIFRRWAIRPRDARLGTDVSLVVVGWLLGGQVGAGTLLITFGLPLVVEPGMRLGAALAGRPDPTLVAA